MFRDLTTRNAFDDDDRAFTPVATLTRRERNLEIASKMLEGLTLVQRQVLADPSRLIVILVPRRGGKTTEEATAHVRTCLMNDSAVCYFGAVTAQRAKDIIWPEIRRLQTEYGFEAHFKEQAKEIVFDNGSLIKMIGCDTRKEIDKQRGTKYHRFTLDEAGSIPGSLVQYLFQSVVYPSLMDVYGAAVIMGTPGVLLSGMFFELSAPDMAKSLYESQGKETKHIRWSSYYDPSKPIKEYAQGDIMRWSLHTWGIRSNTAIPHLWKEALALKELNGWSDDNPTWCREFLGKWVSDAGTRVYRYEPGTNDWEPNDEGSGPHGLPEGKDPWHYLLGIDLGFNPDPFAMVVAAYSDHDPTLYEVYEYTALNQSTGDMFASVQEVIERFGGFDAIVGDAHGAGARPIYEEWAREGILVEPAPKHRKRDFIEIVNSHLHEGRIKWLLGGDLAKEAEGLQWDVDNPRYARGEYAIGRSQPDHLLDAFLYLCRLSQHTIWSPKRVKLGQTDPAYWKARDEADYEKACADRLREENGEWWEEYAKGETFEEGMDAQIADYLDRGGSSW